MRSKRLLCALLALIFCLSSLLCACEKDGGDPTAPAVTQSPTEPSSDAPTDPPTQPSDPATDPVTDPATDPPLLVTMKLSVYDFGTGGARTDAGKAEVSHEDAKEGE